MSSSSVRSSNNAVTVVAFIFVWLLFPASPQAYQGFLNTSCGLTSYFGYEDHTLKFWIHNEDKEILDQLVHVFRIHFEFGLSDHSMQNVVWADARIFKIDLSARNLHGTMPSSLGYLTHLEHLDLSNNNLEGPLPDLSRLSMLKTLNLQNNKLNGTLPNWLTKLASLKQILIQNNDFSGEVPKDLSTSKIMLNCSGNPQLSYSKNYHDYKCFVTMVILLWGLVLYINWIMNSVIQSCIPILLKNEKLRLQLCSSWIRESVMWCMHFISKMQLSTHRISFSLRKSSISTSSTSREDCSLVKATSGSKPKAFTTEEILKATERFSKKIGQGGFGSVFLGNLADGYQIAVKVLSAFSSQGKEEFLNELKLLYRANHRHLISLLGYNSRQNDFMLVYAYMPGGSLKDHLYGPESERKGLSWRERVCIALDAAQGLEYLHVGCNTKFIHRDVKTANILLDCNLRGKLSDFGLSKGLMEHEASHITTLVKGTPGYLDPEYFKTQMLTDKSDVYSFGVVLFEIIFGRQAVNRELPEKEINLVRWATPYLETKNPKKELMKIIDKKLMGRCHNIKSIRRVARVARACVHDNVMWRPRISEVVTELKQAILEEDNATTQPSSYLRSKGVGNLNTILLWAKNKVKLSNDMDKEDCLPSTMADGSKLPVFTINEIKKATRNFSSLLGSGGFGKVYKGITKDGCEIAVKVLSKSSGQGKQEFLSELKLRSLANHKNLASLLGYCSKSSKHMLVYEYMPKGTLASHLHGNSGRELNWRRRLQIAFDVAQGLEYLHFGCELKFIHRDLKCSNVLLDNDFTAKLGDFGLAKWFIDPKASHITTNVAGTIGYLDPEYCRHGKLTEKSDIFAFGVVLLELVCGRRPLELDLPEEERALINWVMEFFRVEEPGTFMKIVDKKLMGTFRSIKSISQVTKLAISCVDMSISQRPNASQVVLELKEAIEEEDNGRFSEPAEISLHYDNI